MTTIEFVIEFHSTFRVGAAYPNDGIDLTYDVDEPLPPTTSRESCAPKPG